MGRGGGRGSLGRILGDMELDRTSGDTGDLKLGGTSGDTGNLELSGTRGFFHFLIIVNRGQLLLTLSDRSVGVAPLYAFEPFEDTHSDGQCSLLVGLVRQSIGTWLQGDDWLSLCSIWH